MTAPYAEQYRWLLAAALAGTSVENRRTGSRVWVLPGHSGTLKVDLDDASGSMLPLPGNRRVYPKLAAAETAWQVGGERDASFVMKHAPKLWRKFLDADGRVENAYGHRLRRYFGRDQLALAVAALDADASDRRVYLGLWDPGRDGLGRPDVSVPCPVGVSLSVEPPLMSGWAQLLHVAVHVRSSDLFVGLPYDVMNFALLGQLVACSLSEYTRVSTLTVFIAHGHVYEAQAEAARRCLGDDHEWQGPEAWPNMPDFTLTRVAEDPDGYVVHVAALAAEVRGHPWRYSAEVVA